MKKLILTTMMYFMVVSLFAQHNFNSKYIPTEIKENANAVFHFNNTNYIRTSASSYTVEHHYAVTILNPKGRKHAYLVVPYDRNSNVVDISGKLYNKFGIETNKLKKKEVKDRVYNNSFTLFSDSRVKYFIPIENSYPYTIEYKYKVKHNAVVGFSTWMPQEDYNTALLNAKLTFNTHPDWDIKFKTLSSRFKSSKVNSDDNIEYTWTIDYLKAIDYEPFSKTYMEVLPTVLLSPNNIKYESTKGDFITWESYGKWVYELIDNRDELSTETIAQLKNLTDTISEETAKIKAVYEYMQNRTRYINIALGIGGFQPMTALQVDELGYGDCKALSNYTMSLLKAVGIKSYYTEIGNGKYQELKFPEFASANQTNHIILCVPQEQDTIWLECTNQEIPFGYLGSGSLNRYVLLIKPNGGELAKTPNYNAEQNTRISKINIDIKSAEHTDISLESTFKNYLYQQVFGLINLSKKEQKELLLKRLTAPGLIINNFSIEDQSKGQATANLKVNGSSFSLLTKAGQRLIYKPEYFQKHSSLKLLSKNRKQDIYQAQGFTLIDTMQVNFPQDYSLEYTPKSKSYTSAYGKYNLHVVNKENQLRLIRTLQINQGTFGPENFDEINTFLKKIQQSDNQKVIALPKS